ncbi:citrate synthase [Listeria fleischmannii]|jgi:citrate synthase|uniref:Citrate synthase n=1 Tax=Listeria fleischmannii TaxID=1069827 RepID=A0A841YB80_9LIST|nr:citrate synthase [Listeria fleischmannii]EIA21373.1 citrate synthase [Listeria fleischmannii subsp. coloradonensis]MBC1397533.1 citrate synthase [Listeria fleischmannii]MBC1418329.1 citrate synthase [Listeria fleischmannii]MBC1425902.1 citrate synthase [Listeria fleischmannii]STY35078.1 Citrate synthase 2 [Listeria fleischmannii subsp. coloradonensis]
MTVSKGLENVYVAETSISSIIDDTLKYVGYSIDDLVTNNVSFEEVVYLLWHLRLPNKQELIKFKDEISEHMAVSETIITSLRMQNHQKLHPMSVLRTTVSMLGVFDTESELDDGESIYKKGLRLQAKMPTIVAAFSRIRRGLDPIPPKQGLSVAANFLYMITGEEADPLSVEAMNKALVLHADHEFNASTFTARVCVATLSDVYSGVTAAIGALKGPLHGGANERVFDMLVEIDDASSNVRDYIQYKIDQKQKIMGFGHRVYRGGDPRAKHLKEMSERLTKEKDEEKWYTLSCQVEEAVWDLKHLRPNVDFYSASVYHALGIDVDLFTLVFSVSRVSGWLAHIFEQYRDNRLIRPRAIYVGPESRDYQPIEKRI